MDIPKTLRDCHGLRLRNDVFLLSMGRGELTVDIADVGTIIIGYDNMPKIGKGDMFYEFLFR